MSVLKKEQLARAQTKKGNVYKAKKRTANKRHIKKQSRTEKEPQRVKKIREITGFILTEESLLFSKRKGLQAFQRKSSLKSYMQLLQSLKKRVEKE